MCTLISGITIRSSLHFPAMDAIFRDQITKQIHFHIKIDFDFEVTKLQVAKLQSQLEIR